MPSTVPPRSLSRADWVRRCAAHIRTIDDVVSLVDAADLASALHDLPCCDGLDPETAAIRLFRDELAPSRGAAAARPPGPTADPEP